ncbi:type IV toxin-antitoxin system AbiEi family antitoxin domain-containing protein [Phenylobacterium sp.]|nr:type IV toxin-antitoxin system AbiEi family antitoxin domain-containing protein [Phenylobacterium sp.]HEX3366722.1 type IV toxin-antitoxin system AbiEi family antitoxin domain-containing protein [Phenylobacterium sp.]
MLAREKGTVTTLELQRAGVHRCYLSPMCKEGLLIRIGHGRYRAAG